MYLLILLEIAFDTKVCIDVSDMFCLVVALLKIDYGHIFEWVGGFTDFEYVIRFCLGRGALGRNSYSISRFISILLVQQCVVYSRNTNIPLSYSPVITPKPLLTSLTAIVLLQKL